MLLSLIIAIQFFRTIWFLVDNQTQLLIFHGALIIPALVSLGVLIVSHIPAGWESTQKRKLGSLLSFITLFLVISGFFLFYTIHTNHMLQVFLFYTIHLNKMHQVFLLYTIPTIHMLTVILYYTIHNNHMRQAFLSNTNHTWQTLHHVIDIYTHTEHK